MNVKGYNCWANEANTGVGCANMCVAAHAKLAAMVLSTITLFDGKNIQI